MKSGLGLFTKYLFKGLPWAGKWEISGSSRDKEFRSLGWVWDFFSKLNVMYLGGQGKATDTMERWWFEVQAHPHQSGLERLSSKKLKTRESAGISKRKRNIISTRTHWCHVGGWEEAAETGGLGMRTPVRKKGGTLVATGSCWDSVRDAQRTPCLFSATWACLLEYRGPVVEVQSLRVYWHPLGHPPGSLHGRDAESSIGMWRVWGRPYITQLCFWSLFLCFFLFFQAIQTFQVPEKVE